MTFNKIVVMVFISLLAISTTSQAQSALDNKYFAQQLEIDKKKRIKHALKKKKRAEAAAAAAAAKTAAPVAQPKPSVSKATAPAPAPAMMGDCKQIQAHYKKMCMTKGDMIRWIK
jgi:Na+-transporting methylmalonyl-CoA/oxaloacetate decarboxylase gamma subunit